MYAFMRRADDIADNESLSMEVRRDIMRSWLTSWHTQQDVATEDLPVFLAVRDVQQRFGVSDHLLDQLVQGTTMDLSPEPPPGVLRTRIQVHAHSKSVDVYENMPALEGYCYLVASVVGLVTIRIFGFTDPAADTFADHLGKAFQFTNILRDIKEDAERGRIYLPFDLLCRHNSSPQQVLSSAAGEPLPEELRLSMSDLAATAEQLYKSADQLIPLLAPDSRPAMRVLVDIYHSLLQAIVAAHFDVFSRRVRVSTPRKLSLLARGLLAGSLGMGLRA